jgi:signal transduction histidine kinase
VIHRCTLVHVAVDRLLLGSEQVRRLQGQVEALTASRAAAVEAEANSFQRLERDLHDGPQQRLVRLGMDLSMAERRLTDDPESARVLLAEARTQTADALAELRALSRGIAPPILIDRGLPAALAAVAARCTVQVDLHVGLREGRRLPASVERSAYFMVSEALTNVAKHSRASRVQVRVLRDRTLLRVEVEDDGIGGAHPAKGQGLAGLADRLTAVDGTLIVDSPPGGPTRLIADIPCALS